MRVGGQRHAPAVYFREWPVLIVREAGLASGPVCTGAENLTPPDPPARSVAFAAYES